MIAMRNVLAVAGLFFRLCVRSKLIISIVLMIAVIGLVLPAQIESDGTLDGRLRVLLYHTLGLVTLLLGVTVTWTACATLPLEINSRRIHLVLTKPVGRSEIWLGTWLGMLALCAALLGFAGLLGYAQVRRVVHDSTSVERDLTILHGRRLVTTETIITAVDVREHIQRMRIESRIPDHTRDESMIETARNEILVARNTVAPGEVRRWEFNLARDHESAPTVQLRFRFATSAPGSGTAEGVWSIGTDTDPHSHRVNGAWQSDHNEMIVVPTEGIRRTLIVEFTNPEDSEAGAIVFDTDYEVALLVRESGFTANYVRALLIIFCELGLLAALGTAAGSLFSLPIAVFVSFSIVIIAALGKYLGLSIAEDPAMPLLYDPLPLPFLNPMIENMARFIQSVTAPWTQYDVLARLADGILVPWSMVGSALVVLIGAYGLSFAIIGIIVFKLREIGLPD